MSHPHRPHATLKQENRTQPPGPFMDPTTPMPRRDFRDGKIYDLWEQRVKQSDNDFIVVIAASSKSAVSGVGKTTLGITMARYFDQSEAGFSAEHKATLEPGEFARDMLADDDEASVANKSAVLADEFQGTLSSDGADARRSMADSVRDISAALATLRFRQLSAIIITQSPDWIDKRIDELMDVLVLIQGIDERTDEVYAKAFDTYYNDLGGGQRYTEEMATLTWPALPDSDPDYQELHRMKKQSALDEKQAEEEEDPYPEKDQQINIAQEMRNKGFEAQEIADSPMIEYGQDWVYKHTDNPEVA